MVTMDINKIRYDTPGCQDKLFLNSAGSSLMPRSVTQSIVDYIQAEEQEGGYNLVEIRHSEIAEFYSQVGQLLHCNARNVAFANNATDAYAKALSTITFKKGDTIITSEDDYVSNHIYFITMKKRLGINIECIRTFDSGDLDLDHLERLIVQHQPRLVAITHIPTNSGLIQDVEQVGSICQARGILYLVDSCQSVGQIDVDVNKIKCDFLCASGRKFLRGPRGTGFLYVSDRVLDEQYFPMYLDLAGAAMTSPDEYKIVDSSRRFETWELPYALIIGLKEACQYANEIGIEAIEQYNRPLISNFRKKLISIPGVRLYDKGAKTGNIITFRKQEKSRKRTQEVLNNNQVYYSMSGKSYAYRDFDKKGVDWVVRLSPHYFNTPDELNQVANIIESI